MGRSDKESSWMKEMAFMLTCENFLFDWEGWYPWELQPFDQRMLVL